MIGYLVKKSVILCLLQIAVLLAVLWSENQTVDFAACVIGCVGMFFYMFFAKRRCSKVLRVPVDVLQSMDVVPESVGYQKGKFVLAAKVAGILMHFACFAPFVLYLAENIFYYYAMQPSGYNEKIVDPDLIMVWAVLSVSGAAMPALYYKLKEASVICNTEDAEERSWRQGLARKMTEEAQQSAFLYQLWKMTR